MVCVVAGTVRRRTGLEPSAGSGTGTRLVSSGEEPDALRPLPPALPFASPSCATASLAVSVLSRSPVGGSGLGKFVVSVTLLS